jgi:3-phosphoglycerate kinase
VYNICKKLADVSDKMSHFSTGGGANLKLLEGKPIPGVLALDGRVLTNV